MCDLVGWGRERGGTLTSGGTEATFTALLAARARAMPDAWSDGVGADAAGGALRRARALRRDARRRRARTRHAQRASRSVARLAHGHRRAARRSSTRCSATGRRVMAVVATAGSTATGSFDDLDTHRRRSARRAASGCTSTARTAARRCSRPRIAHRVRGIARARSIAWDPHKMMLLPLAAGMRARARRARPRRARSPSARRISFTAPTGERVWDQGTRSFLCSRRADALKLWVALQRYGAAGFGALYDHLCDRRAALHDAARGAPRLRGAARARVEHPLLPLGRRRHARTTTRSTRSTASCASATIASARGWITTTISAAAACCA